MSKRVKVLFCFLAVLLVCSGCYSPPEDAFDKDMRRVVFVSPQKELPVWLQAKAGFLDSAQDYGFQAEWLGSEDCDLDEMTRQISIAIAENVDAIVTCPLTPSVFDEVFSQAKEKGIPVIAVAVDASHPELRSAFISPDYQKIGHDQAVALHEAVGGEMKIGVIMSTFDSQNQIIQLEELKRYIQDLEGSEIVAYGQDFANPMTGMSVFSEMLEEHPEINAVFVTSGDAVSNYGKILAEKGLQDSIVLIGMDAVEENARAILEGEIYGVMDQDYYQMGYSSGEYAYKILNGETVPQTTFCDSMLVTAQNVQQVMDSKESEVS